MREVVFRRVFVSKTKKKKRASGCCFVNRANDGIKNLPFIVLKASGIDAKKSPRRWSRVAPSRRADVTLIARYTVRYEMRFGPVPKLKKKKEKEEEEKTTTGDNEKSSSCPTKT